MSDKSKSKIEVDAIRKSFVSAKGTLPVIGGLSFSALQHFGVSYQQQFILAASVLLLGTVQLFWVTRARTAVN